MHTPVGLTVHKRKQTDTADSEDGKRSKFIADDHKMSLCSHSVVGGVNILAKVPPLSKHQKEFLRVYIHKQRKQKAQEGEYSVNTLVHVYIFRIG